MKSILSGNEAIARGFIEAGGGLAAAYPGTPSTEVLEAVARYGSAHAEWSTNEKVALEVAIGGSLSGVRSMASMKGVGLNVAADPLMTLSYTGVNAGLVLMVADDPGMFSSQNEQDTRRLAQAAKVPCLEPSDSAEAMQFTKLALSLSEEFDTPVMLRTTTRVSHGRGVVELSEPDALVYKGSVRDIPKYVMMPTFGRARHEFVEKRLVRLRAWAEDAPLNRVHEGGDGLGVITSGVSYNYVREAFPDASVLKLGMSYPIPEKMVKEFAGKVKKLAVVEELDPVIEDAVRALGVRVDYGKGVLSACGEFSARTVREAITGEKTPVQAAAPGLPERPPTFCPGCSHRGLFVALKKLKARVYGDIGCYTLGALPPYSAIDAVVCMGASIPGAHGMAKGLSLQGRSQKPVAVIGDSTFLHSGITGLINLVYNAGDAVVIIMNNSGSAMTGGQAHPGAGRTVKGTDAAHIDFAALCRAVGVPRVREFDSRDISGLQAVIRKELDADGPSVLVSNQPCVLRSGRINHPSRVDVSECDGCAACLMAGCMALSLVEDAGAKSARIDPLICAGCSVCAQLCPRGAIHGGDA